MKNAKGKGKKRWERGHGKAGSYSPIASPVKLSKTKSIACTILGFLYILYNPCINTNLASYATCLIVVELRYGSLYLYHFNNKQLL